MFDISFGELAVIGVVALVVIGPEKLPKVARTVGALVGRAQRYVHDVKADIQREVNLASSSNCTARMHDAAQSLRNTVQTQVDEARQAGGRGAEPAERSQPDRHAHAGRGAAQLDAVNQTVVERRWRRPAAAHPARPPRRTLRPAQPTPSCRRPRQARPAPWLPPKPPRPFLLPASRHTTDSQPLLAHLIELRTRLVRALIGLGLMFLGLFHWSGDIYHLLAAADAGAAGWRT